MVAGLMPISYFFERVLEPTGSADAMKSATMACNIFNFLSVSSISFHRLLQTARFGLIRGPV
jgi:hypothetical protein